MNNLIAMLEIIRYASAIALCMALAALVIYESGKMALILLITIAVLAGIDVVMYILLGAIEKHWEKKFKEDKDDTDDDKRGV